jgi:hypothetical protein
VELGANRSGGAILCIDHETEPSIPADEFWMLHMFAKRNAGGSTVRAPAAAARHMMPIPIAATAEP